LTEAAYFAHVQSLDVEGVDKHVGMAVSLCPRADCRYRSLRPDAHEERMRTEFLNALRDVCASAMLQCSGDTEYEAMARCSRGRIAAHLADGTSLVKLKRGARQVNRKVA
jgi:hypothetical protein